MFENTYCKFLQSFPLVSPMFPEAIGVVANFMNGWDTQQGMILLAPLSAGHGCLDWIVFMGVKPP